MKGPCKKVLDLMELQNPEPQAQTFRKVHQAIHETSPASSILQNLPRQETHRYRTAAFQKPGRSSQNTLRVSWSEQMT